MIAVNIYASTQNPVSSNSIWIVACMGGILPFLWDNFGRIQWKKRNLNIRRQNSIMVW